MAMRQAVRLVDENWGLVETLARELYKLGELERNEIERLIPRLMKAKKARPTERLRISATEANK